MSAVESERALSRRQIVAGGAAVLIAGLLPASDAGGENGVPSLVEGPGESNRRLRLIAALDRHGPELGGRS